MGRARKPLSEQNKHLTKSEKSEKEYFENKINVGQEDLHDTGKIIFVNKFAENEYMRVLRIIEKSDTINDYDLAFLEGYANAYGLYVFYKEKMSGREIIRDGNGNEIPNPIAHTLIKFGEEVRRYAKICGLSIDSRLKAAALKTTEELEQIVTEFGDI